MTKKEIIKEIKELIYMDKNREFFCKEYKLKEEDFYPGYHGYIISNLNYIIERDQEEK